MADGDGLMFIFGAIIGSFVGTAIVRLPLNGSLIRPRSHCPQCNSVLGILDLVPVLSWLWLKGRCRYCQASISGKYIGLEIFSGVMMVVLYRHFGMQALFIKYAVLFYFLIVVAGIDFKYQLILNNVMLYMGGFGLFIRWMEAMVVGAGVWAEVGYACMVAGGIMAVIFLLSRGGMGWGDVVFVVVMAIWMDATTALLTIFLAFVLGGAWGVILIASGRRGGKDYIPFAPFLGGGAVLSLLYGEVWMEYYKMILL